VCITLGSHSIDNVIKPDIGRELLFLHTPPAFDTLIGGSLYDYCHNVWYGKIRMVFLPAGDINFADMFICFD